MSPARTNTASDSVNEIATVRIELRHTDPLIWRQVEVPTSITLKVLHDIIQAVMGWFDYHLWEFTIGDENTAWRWTRIGEHAVRLWQARYACATCCSHERPSIDYTYDFGDRGSIGLQSPTSGLVSRGLLSALHWRRKKRAARGLRRHSRLLRMA